ncbi:unnamed protein product [Arctia plantaginis]|uniref:FP protein C-terminal domain-containing protein n=1 Tax=Arctia plantaginis TaxID=874455 RepID=A0A8S1BWB9_ARCPL|nr:unnamed protein product [Arctia plantaginis]
MPVTNCAGCLVPIKSKDRLQCISCHSFFDLPCADITERRFRSLSTEWKGNWKCPECCSRIPNSDNANTPVARSTSKASVAVSSQSRGNITTPIESPQIPPNFVTEDRLREILKDEISSTIKSTIKQLITTEFKTIYDKITDYQESMTFLSKQYEDIRVRLDDTISCMNELKRDNERLKTTVSDLTGRLCSTELHMRECNVEVNGVPENRSENLINTIVQLTKVIESPLSSDDIHQVTRVAKLSRDSERPRAIVAKLRNPRTRDILLAAVTKFNKQNPQDKLSTSHLGIGGTRSPVFVSEHLTPSNKHLHAAARKKAKELSYKFVWVRNGRVYVRKDENHQAISIRSEDSLNLIK